MTSDLSLVRSMRRVLESAGEGRGLARSVVEELRGTGEPGEGAARRLLLGHPLRASLRVLAESSSDEAAMLASLIVAAPESSASVVGRSGEELAGTLEKWVRAREARKVEQKVMRFRSVITSGVLGAVTAMISSLGPLVGSLNFGGSVPSVDPSALLAGAALMAAIGSGILGVYMSGRGFVLNVGVTLGAFALVTAAASPLSAFPSGIEWGVK